METKPTAMEEPRPALFPSLLQALGGLHNHNDGDSVPVNDSVGIVLQEWWRQGPLGGENPTKEHYAQFYHRLVDVLRQNQLLSGVNYEDSVINQWIDADWLCDEHEQQSPDAFLTALRAITMHTTDTLASIQKLREACSETDPSVPLGTEKRPMTMAEKLSCMRSKRLPSATDASKAAPLPTEAVPPAVDLTPLTSVIEKTTPAVSSIDPLRGDDDAAHYFTIETRMELKERLVVLQRRLDDLLLQTKLAWMKCFAHSTQQNDAVAPTTDCNEAAMRLVTDGEALAFHLAEAFDQARKATAPINEYKTLVATCETQFAAFEALAHTTAVAPSPVREQAARVEPQMPLSTTELVTIQKPKPAAFDLPSMKTYYEKAAPSYTAYLPHKKR